jgi:hypothetical protein
MKSATNRLAALIAIICLAMGPAAAQPYIDLFNGKYVSSPAIGPTSSGRNATQLDYFNAGATLPIQFRNKRDALILSPFVERWSTTVENVKSFNQYHYGIVMPVSLLKTIPSTQWSLLLMAIVRMNDALISTDAQWQIGGAVVGTQYKKSAHLTYKFGVYFNGEFFGLFVIPLVGIDWQINDRTNLFGILPASLTLERKMMNRLYIGAVVRTYTNSYHDNGNQYIRIDENQLGAFVDIYASKHVVINLESGHSLFRKIRNGTKYDIKTNWNVSDNFYFKCSLAYRLRLR